MYNALEGNKKRDTFNDNKQLQTTYIFFIEDTPVSIKYVIDYKIIWWLYRINISLLFFDLFAH